MSHYLDLKTTITDAEALARALTRMGIPRSAIQIHNKAVDMDGWNGQQRKANVLVKKQWIHDHQQQCDMKAGYAYSDMGFIQEADGSYKALVDDHNFSPAWVQKMSTYYNVEKTKIELDAKKITYSESTEKGLPVITAKIPNRNKVVNKAMISFN